MSSIHCPLLECIQMRKGRSTKMDALRYGFVTFYKVLKQRAERRAKETEILV